MKLFLEDDVLRAGDATSVVVSVANHSRRSATLSTFIHIQRNPRQDAPHQLTTAMSPAPPAEDETTQQFLRDALRIVLTIRGSFPAGATSVLPVRSHRIAALSMEPAKNELLIEPIAGGTFQEGIYEVQATLFEGTRIVGESKVRTIRVSEVNRE
jgi:hypothetical protein